MLNYNFVLKYIKNRLGWPHVMIELDDDQILDYIKTFSLKEFSYYFPQKWKTVLNLDLAINKVPGVQNEFYITEPQGLEIFNVISVIQNESDYYIHGHQPLGNYLTLQGTKEFALSVNNYGMLSLFSPLGMTWEFRTPNVIRISPVMNRTSYVTIEYEREQPSDLSGISNEIQMYFCDFCLADCQINLGNIRTKYGNGNLQTPFGNISLNSDILNEGKTLKTDIINKLQIGAMLNISITTM